MYAAYDASVDELIPSDGTLSAQRIEGFGDRLVLDADAPDNSTESKDLYWNMYVMTPKAGAENSSGLGCLMQFDYHTRIKPIPAYNEQKLHQDKLKWRYKPRSIGQYRIWPCGSEEKVRRVL